MKQNEGIYLGKNEVQDIQIAQIQLETLKANTNVFLGIMGNGKCFRIEQKDF